MATAIISNQQCACLRSWYHKPDGTSMIARGNINKEDQDFGIVESLKTPVTPFAYFLLYDLYLRQ